LPALDRSKMPGFLDPTMLKLAFPAAIHLALFLAITLAPSLGSTDISKKPYSEIVGDNPVATMVTSDDVPAQDNSNGDFVGDSWYEAGITITSDQSGVGGWNPYQSGDMTMGSNDPGGVLLSLDEPANQLGLNWYWSAAFDVTLYSDTSHSAVIGDIGLSPTSDGETTPEEDGYDLGILSTEAFQSVRISCSSTNATIDDLVYVPSPEPGLLVAQLTVLLTLSLLCLRSR
jgi:hypothetical protein